VAGRRLAHDDRRAAILRVAREQFSARPYGSVSVGDIARAAGVSPPLIVHYYGSKQSLYLEVLQTAVTTIAEGLQAIPGPASLERLRASVRFYAGYAREHQAGFLSFVRGGLEGGLPEAAELVGSLRARIAEQLLADVRPGLPALDEAQQATLAIGVRGYLGYVDAVIVPWLDQPEEVVGTETVVELAVGAFTGMLAAVHPSDGPVTEHATGRPAP
jgi:AcrR family transcriptional regulator